MADPLTLLRRALATVRIDRDPLYACWLWRGRLDREGYPDPLAGQRVYRLVERLWRGPIEPPLDTVDHVCRRRACIAPHHLERVSRREQELRKAWHHRVRTARCVAGAGHPSPLGDAAIVTPEMGLVCRECLIELDDPSALLLSRIEAALGTCGSPTAQAFSPPRG